VIATDITVLLIPLWILLGLVAVLLVLGILGRIQNGRYLKPLIVFLMKVPLFKRWLEKGSKAAMERSNPELASAMRKLEPHQKHLNDRNARRRRCRSSPSRSEPRSWRCRISRAPCRRKRRTGRCGVRSKSSASAPARRSS
jgi:hypothetical protein